jgi:hypothetical protein
VTCVESDVHCIQFIAARLQACIAETPYYVRSHMAQCKHQQAVRRSALCCVQARNCRTRCSRTHCLLLCKLQLPGPNQCR